MDEGLTITIIGSGNVATVFAVLLKQSDFVINEIFSRNNQHAQKLAIEVNANVAEKITALSTSDVYVIAVNDNAIANLSNELPVDNKIVIHTSGSVSKNVLKTSTENFGVLYPLQSLRKEINQYNNIPLLVDGSNNYTNEIIYGIAASISNNIQKTNDEERLKYHLSAVIVSNFSNHLFALTKNYCNVNNIDFTFLFPLIEETVSRMHQHDPAEMQTGPAIRGDVATIGKHLDLLNNFPQLKTIYQLITKSINSNL